MDRKLIHNAEEKISYLQIMGFIVILFALIYLIIKQLFYKLDGDFVSMNFFSIMLGIAFAFPDLLQDSNKGLSTMRIVVFMMINVICILLLQIGWGKHSLKDIGIDQYWMGIIAFVFGAKATQSYFESKMAVLPGPTDAGPPNGGIPNGGGSSGGPSAGGSAGGGTASGGLQPGNTAAQDELDGCGIIATQFTADTDLPASKGGMV